MTTRKLLFARREWRAKSTHPGILIHAIFLLVCLLSGCGKQESADSVEHAYVASSQLEEVALRDRVAAVYSKVAVVKNGDRVRVLERSQNKRFVRVRTEAAKEGWIEQRYLIGQDIYDSFQKLSRENANAPAQATAIVHRLLNLHVQPYRNSETLYQLKENAKVELLRRTSSPRGGAASATTAAQPKLQAEKSDSEAKRSGKNSVSQQGSKSFKKVGAKSSPLSPDAILEDWWLVRDSQKRVGWLRGRTLDIEVPIEIGQYAEGQRIVGSFILNTVEDNDGHSVPQFAVLMTEPQDGLPFDFNQLRVFTWNKKRSRYETAFRDRFDGELPFTVAKQDFGKEGVLLTFTARFRDSEGKLQERKYKMNGVIVRRITAPGESLPMQPRKMKKRR